MKTRSTPEHRRASLRLLALGALALSGLSACHPFHTEPLRLAAQPWPGYEFLYLARELKLLDNQQIHLIETPSASASLRGLATRSIDGACLTLDEVLTARSNGIALTVVAVLDESRGADALIAQSPFASMADLRGKTIGVEQTAVGAVLLNAALESVGMTLADVQTRFISVDNHVSAFRSGKVDAVVTYEPHKAQLLDGPARTLFSSAQTPGLILDTVAIRTELLAPKKPQIQAMLRAHFAAYQRWLAQPDQHNAILGSRLDLNPEQVNLLFREIYFPSVQENRDWMRNHPSQLQKTAENLAAIMLKQGLLSESAAMENLFTPAFLP